jgi:Abnormal spindle-like microcephaly-assoc'd, ASPM-SPD-2-Hydin
VRDLGARPKAVVVLLVITTMLGCQALNASKPSQSNPAADTQGNALIPSTPVLDFGTVFVGSSEVLSNTIVNTSQSSVRIKKAALGNSEFKITGERLPVTLAPGESTSLEITYRPHTHGSSQDKVTLATNDSSFSTSFSVQGKAVSAGQLQVSPTSLSFGMVAVGTSASKTATLSNSGGSNLTVNQVTTSDSEFSVSGIALPLVLAPSQSAPVIVTYTPSSSGTDSGSVSITAIGSTSGGGHKGGKGGRNVTSSSTSLTAATVAVSGTGITSGQLAATPASIDMGNVEVGSNRVVSGTLTNSGGTSITVSQAALTGAGFTMTSWSLPLTLAAGQSAGFTVKFAPQSPGPASATIAVVSDAENPTLNVPITGMGVSPGSLVSSPSSLSFGAVQVSSSQMLSATVTNSGGSPATISQATVTGAGYSMGSLSMPVTLSAGQSKTFNITFSPQSSGSKSGSLSITSDASNPTLTVPLSGSGTAPGSLAATPSSLSFGSVQVGNSQSLQETLTNSGGSSVTISQVNAPSTAFTISGITLPLNLGAGQSTNFNVKFSPQSAGSANGNLSVVSDASNSNLDIPLSGSGLSAGTLAASPASLSFGSVQVGNSQSLQETLTNSGGSSVTISQVNAPSTAFTVSGITLPLSLGAGQSTNFSVKFSPQSAGSANGNLSVVSDASNSSLDIPLSASGVTAGTLGANPASLSFGSVQVGSTKTMQQTLTNSGGSSVKIMQANVPTTAFTVSGITLPMTLGAGQSTNFSVKFSPQSAGSANGNLSVVSDASNSSLDIPLSATAVTAGTLAATPASLSFGSVQVSSTKTMQQTLTNSGGSSVTISQANVPNAAFTVTGLSLPLTLGAGQSTNFSVKFSPQSGGAVSGNLSIISDASNSTLNIALSGSGTTPGLLSVSSSALSFGSVQVNSSATKSETVTNSGGTTVTVTDANVSRPEFSVTGLSLPLALSPGQSFTFGVKFAPSSGGAVTDSLTLGSDASNPSLSVSLSGTGTVVGQLAVSPATLNFGSVVVGQSKSMSATLSATGANVTVSSAGFSTSEFTLSGVAFPFTVNAGQSASVTVMFKPQASGSATDSVSFASNASNSPAVAALTGSGTPPPQHRVDLSWSPSSSSVVGYNIYRGSRSGGPYGKINSALNATTSYTDNSVLAGTTYFYVTTAVDGNGMESSFSNQVQAVVPSP